jgi:hypothetical protein
MNDNNAKPAPLQVEAEQALTAQLNEAATNGLPFPVGGALTSIKTLLERDPLSHAGTAIKMIDAILSQGGAAQTEKVRVIPLLDIWSAAELRKEDGEGWSLYREGSRVRHLDIYECGFINAALAAQPAVQLSPCYQLPGQLITAAHHLIDAQLAKTLKTGSEGGAK